MRIGSYEIIVRKATPSLKDIEKQMRRIIKLNSYTVDNRVLAIKDTRNYFLINYPNSELLSLKIVNEMSKKIFGLPLN